MLRFGLLLIAVLGNLAGGTALAQVAPGQTGATLIQTLRASYKPTASLNYTTARQKMFGEIDNRNGKVRCVYTGYEIATTVIPNHNKFNTEHTWPQSLFDDKLPMRADLHHLFPTRNDVNGRRSHFPFADIPDANTDKWWLDDDQQSSIPTSNIDSYSESSPGVFEPRHDHKGNVARAMLYFWVIYGDKQITPGFIQSQLPTLTAWHELDKVDQAETDRNQKIKNFQGNENPFILDETLVYRVQDLQVPTPQPVVTPVPAPAIAAAAPSQPRDASVTQPVTIRVVSWNMQSNLNNNTVESNPVFLKSQLAAKSGVHLWGLSEVLNANALREFEEGAEDGEATDFNSVMGTTGGRDRLAILYDANLFEQIGTPFELKTETQLSSGMRAALVLRLRGKRTGQEFLFMVNHLYRGNDMTGPPNRLQQGQNLNTWARSQTLPIIAVGDYNFDYDVTQGHLGFPHRDAGFDALISDNVFQWVKPNTLFRTHSDSQYDSVLDFVFVANAPFGWTGSSRILEREGDTPAVSADFTDNAQSTDHRPVDAVFTLTPQPNPTPRSRDELTQRIGELEAELNNLREQLRELPDE